MRNTTTQFMILATIALLTVSQVNASEQEAVLPNRSTSVITKISNCLHRMPVISLILTRKVKFDYVAEDSMLDNYMLGSTSESVIAELTSDVSDEIASIDYAEEDMFVYEDSSDNDLIAYEEIEPISFAADFEDDLSDAMEEVELDVAP